MGATPATFAGFFARGFAGAFTFALAFSITTLSTTQDACEPGLLFAGQAGRPVIVLQLLESGRLHVAAPGFQVVIGPVASLVPALLVRTTRIRAEQYPARLERSVQLAQNARQFGSRNVEQ